MLRESERSRWAHLTWRYSLLLLLLTGRVWAFSGNLGIGFYGFDLWDIPSQFLEGHFLFLILMSFSCVAQSFRGGGKSRKKAAPKRHTACAEVPVLGKVTGRGHLVEASNTTAHFCKPLAHERGIFWFGDWLLAITDWGVGGVGMGNSPFFETSVSASSWADIRSA